MHCINRDESKISHKMKQMNTESTGEYMLKSDCELTFASEQQSFIPEIRANTLNESLGDSGFKSPKTLKENTDNANNIAINGFCNKLDSARDRNEFHVINKNNDDFRDEDEITMKHDSIKDSEVYLNETAKGKESINKELNIIVDSSKNKPLDKQTNSSKPHSSKNCKNTLKYPSDADPSLIDYYKLHASRKPEDYQEVNWMLRNWSSDDDDVDSDDKSDIINYQSNWIRQGVKGIACHLCDFSTSRRYAFFQHVKAEHIQKRKPTRTVNNKTTPTSEIRNNKTCEICGYNTSSTILADLHKQKFHKDLSCTDCQFLTKCQIEYTFHMIAQHPQSQIGKSFYANPQWQEDEYRVFTDRLKASKSLLGSPYPGTGIVSMPLKSKTTSSPTDPGSRESETQGTKAFVTVVTLNSSSDKNKGQSDSSVVEIDKVNSEVDLKHLKINNGEILLCRNDSKSLLVGESNDILNDRTSDETILKTDTSETLDKLQEESTDCDPNILIETEVDNPIISFDTKHEVDNISAKSNCDSESVIHTKSSLNESDTTEHTEKALQSYSTDTIYEKQDILSVSTRDESKQINSEENVASFNAIDLVTKHPKSHSKDVIWEQHDGSSINTSYEKIKQVTDEEVFASLNEMDTTDYYTENPYFKSYSNSPKGTIDDSSSINTKPLVNQEFFLSCVNKIDSTKKFEKHTKSDSTDLMDERCATFPTNTNEKKQITDQNIFASINYADSTENTDKTTKSNTADVMDEKYATFNADTNEKKQMIDQNIFASINDADSTESTDKTTKSNAADVMDERYATFNTNTNEKKQIIDQNIFASINGADSTENTDKTTKSNSADVMDERYTTFNANTNEKKQIIDQNIFTSINDADSTENTDKTTKSNSADVMDERYATLNANTNEKKQLIDQNIFAGSTENTDTTTKSNSADVMDERYVTFNANTNEKKQIIDQNIFASINDADSTENTDKTTKSNSADGFPISSNDRMKEKNSEEKYPSQNMLVDVSSKPEDRIETVELPISANNVPDIMMAFKHYFQNKYCPFCDKLMRGMQYNKLCTHLFRHLQIKPYMCTECDYVTDNQKALNNHISRENYINYLKIKAGKEAKRREAEKERRRKYLDNYLKGKVQERESKRRDKERKQYYLDYKAKQHKVKKSVNNDSINHEPSTYNTILPKTAPVIVEGGLPTQNALSSQQELPFQQIITYNTFPVTIIMPSTIYTTDNINNNTIIHHNLLSQPTTNHPIEPLLANQSNKESNTSNSNINTIPMSQNSMQDDQWQTYNDREILKRHLKSYKVAKRGKNKRRRLALNKKFQESSSNDSDSEELIGVDNDDNPFQMNKPDSEYNPKLPVGSVPPRKQPKRSRKTHITTIHLDKPTPANTSKTSLKNTRVILTKPRVCLTKLRKGINRHSNKDNNKSKVTTKSNQQSSESQHLVRQNCNKFIRRRKPSDLTKARDRPRVVPLDINPNIPKHAIPKIMTRYEQPSHSGLDDNNSSNLNKQKACRQTEAVFNNNTHPNKSSTLSRFCNICKVSFLDQLSQNLHIWIVHRKLEYNHDYPIPMTLEYQTELSQQLCPYCRNHLPNFNSLQFQTHILQHLCLFPYKCNKCKFTCISQKLLTQHECEKKPKVKHEVKKEVKEELEEAKDFFISPGLCAEKYTEIKYE